MLKSGIISLFVLLLLAAAVYFDVFVWLASSNATWVGIGLVILMLAISFLVLGSPFRKKE